MKYDKEVYRHSVMPEIKRWRASRPQETPIKAVSGIVQCTSCPIIVVCELLLEIEPSSELERQLESLRKFYDC
jgi:hypothetical protein